ncbi:hypothetical protein GCK32_022294, partial [Trichostrongylus colubriformis]
ITPALSCTFTEEPYPQVLDYDEEKTTFKTGDSSLKDCLRACYESQECNMIEFDKDGCLLLVDGTANGPDPGKTSSTGRLFELNRNIFDTSCSTIEESDIDAY